MNKFKEVLREVMTDRIQYNEHKEEMLKSYNKYLTNLNRLRVMKKITLKEIADGTGMKSRQAVDRVLKGGYYTKDSTLIKIERFLIKK